MPQCSQCSRPAMYVVEGHPLCLEHRAVHQDIVDRELAALENQRQQALEAMEMIAGVQLPRSPRPPPQPQPVIITGSTFHSINIKVSNVGVVNTGQLRLVDTAISVIGQITTTPLFLN